MMEPYPPDTVFQGKKERERERRYKCEPGDFPAVQWSTLCLPVQRVWVQSLVEELKSQMPQQPKKPKHKIDSSVQPLSPVWLFVTLWTAAYQASLSITNSQSLLKLMSIESVMLSSHLICHPLLLLPPIPPSIRNRDNIVTNSVKAYRKSEPEYH